MKYVAILVVGMLMGITSVFATSETGQNYNNNCASCSNNLIKSGIQFGDDGGIINNNNNQNPNAGSANSLSNSGFNNGYNNQQNSSSQ